jgi:hypothetical protein
MSMSKVSNVSNAIDLAQHTETIRARKNHNTIRGLSLAVKYVSKRTLLTSSNIDLRASIVDMMARRSEFYAMKKE